MVKFNYTILLLLALDQCSSFSFPARSGASIFERAPANVNSFRTRSTGLQSSSGADLQSDIQDLGRQILKEGEEIASCAGVAIESLFISASSAEEVVLLCDEIEGLTPNEDLFFSRQVNLRKLALEWKRYQMLASLMRNDYDAYVATASFLSPSRIPRLDLPNLEDVPFDKTLEVNPKVFVSDDGVELVADCDLEDMKYQESPLDKLLLSIFRKLVVENSNGVAVSDQEGLDGLVEQGRTFMLQPGQTSEAQHKMVRDTLAGLMTPVLPPFYRIFMSGIVPNIGTPWDGKQIGPWFYAPFLTSFVTPTFFGFLVGPSKPNYRKDGQLGGLVVEKCKFLQESGCKGICLHQCKLPAQQFFKDELGLPLTVVPNFVTQECQWSFGQEPVPPSEDPYFPKGCLSGCESRKAMAGSTADVCN